MISKGIIIDRPHLVFAKESIGIVIGKNGLIDFCVEKLRKFLEGFLDVEIDDDTTQIKDDVSRFMMVQFLDIV